LALPCERGANGCHPAEATVSGAAGPHSRQRALLGVGQMSGGRREGAVSEEQSWTGADPSNCQKLNHWTTSQLKTLNLKQNPKPIGPQVSQKGREGWGNTATTLEDL